MLAFRENLTDQEIGQFINEVSERIKREGFQEGFQMAMDKIREYLTCDELIYPVAMILKGSLLMSGLEDLNPYMTKINDLIEQMTQSTNQDIRHQALSMIINQTFEVGDLDKAQTYINMLPNITYDKTEKQGALYIK